MSTAPPLHPAAEVLGFLLGRWEGDGRGQYPTIEPFPYVEAVSFGHAGKPWLSYEQRTRHPDDGRPLHAETGFLRPVGAGAVEVVMAYPTGHVEVATGVIDGTTLTVDSTVVHATATAKRVDRVRRVLTVDGDELRYELAMAAVGLPLTPHLAATLHRR